FGSKGNNFSMIKKGWHTFPINHKIPTYGIVDCDQYLPFWVSWSKSGSNLTISAGKGMRVGFNQFIQWTDTSNIWDVKHVGIKSYYNAIANWRFYTTRAHEDFHNVTGPYYIQSHNYPIYEWGINAKNELCFVKEGDIFFMVQPGIAFQNETVSFQLSSKNGNNSRHYLHLEHPDEFALGSTF
ncbi:unnamed protein product, partial [Owenia fusiformis]